MHLAKKVSDLLFTQVLASLLQRQIHSQLQCENTQNPLPGDPPVIICLLIRLRKILNPLPLLNNKIL